MISFFGAAMRQVEINMSGMQILDWAIVIGMIVVLTSVLFYCNHYTRNVADFAPITEIAPLMVETWFC